MRCWAGVVLAALVYAGPALAQQPAASDRTLAESLFRQARALIKEGKAREACPKFEESQRLDPGGGTLLNLADCHERIGRTATAWAEFSEALALARRDGRRDRIALAEKQIAKLEPLLPKLLVNVSPDAGVDGFEVRLDADTIPRAAWSTPMPIDPGPRVIRASAPGYETFVRRVEAKPGATVEVQIGPLEPSAEAPVAERPSESRAGPAVSTAPRDTGRDRAAPEQNRGARTAGWVMLGAGVVSSGVGAAFGVRAFSKRSASDDECPAGECTTRGVALNEDAKDAALVSNITFGIGVPAVGVGLYLLLTSRPEKPKSAKAVSIAPVGSRSGGGLLMTGRF